MLQFLVRYSTKNIVVVAYVISIFSIKNESYITTFNTQYLSRYVKCIIAFASLLKNGVSLVEQNDNPIKIVLLSNAKSINISRFQLSSER